MTISDRTWTYSLGYYTGSLMITDFVTAARPLTVADVKALVGDDCEIAFFKDVF